MTERSEELDLHAYVDNQLDEGGRFAVEAHLSRHPELAARLMGELSIRTGLRLLAGSDDPAPDMMMQRAATLSRASRPLWRKALPLSGIGIAAAISGLMLMTDAPPSYVNMAVASHRVAMMRAHMDSQIEAQALDHKEILSSTRIDLPALPPSWNVTDVQLFPAGRNPALLVAVRTAEGKRLSIFAVRERSGAPEMPDAVREGDQSVAYWRRGDMSYALTGEEEPGAIDRTAEVLNRSWS